jgi:DNA-binding transcriptional ArsR family regulator
MKDPALIDREGLDRAAGCLRTLAHPIRLRIVELLLTGEYTVGELAEACGAQNHVVSEHLGIMRDRGLLERERRGRRMYYSVAMPALNSIIDCMHAHF